MKKNNQKIVPITKRLTGVIKKNPKKTKKEALFIRLLNKILKLEALKLFEIGIGWVKGMTLKVEFYERRSNNENTKK